MKPNRSRYIGTVFGSLAAIVKWLVSFSAMSPGFGDGSAARAHVAERAAAAAVADVVQLEDDAARIGDEQIARAAVRRPAFVLPPRANERLLRSRLLRVGGAAVKPCAVSVCIARSTEKSCTPKPSALMLGRLAGRRRTKREEPRTVADPQQHGRSLTRLHRHAEQSLVEVERSRRRRRPSA